MCDALRAVCKRFRSLDAGQLVKHVFGLVTEGRRKSKKPVRLYLFSEPPDAGRTIAFADHRAELDDFSDQVAGDQVRFASCNWAEWVEAFADDATSHADAMRKTFALGVSVASGAKRSAT